MAVTTSPVSTAAPSSAASRRPERNGPLPSSIVTPSPSASALGADVTVPETASRSPSNGSEASPVVAASGLGSSARPVRDDRVRGHGEHAKAEVAGHRAR